MTRSVETRSNANGEPLQDGTGHLGARQKELLR